MTGPVYEMLRFLSRCDDACMREKVEPQAFWGTHGIGGGRVAKPLAKKGFVTLGWTNDGYAGAKITPKGRKAFIEACDEMNAGVDNGT